MTKRSTIICGLLISAVVFAAQEPFFSLKSAKGEFEIRNYSSIVFESGLPGAGKFTATGTPLKMNWKDAGLSANSASAEGETAEDATTGDYYLRSANLAGNASVTIDSEEAYAFKVQLAQAQGAPPPPSTPERSHLTFLSETIQYSGDLNIGTATIPNVFTGAWTKHGIEQVKQKDQVVQRVYDDTAEAHGSNATIEFLTHAVGDVNPIRKGSILGAATFSYSRKSTLGGVAEAPTTITGGADRIDIDLVGQEHTVTLTGSVHMEGTRAGYRISTSASKAVLVFGPNNALQQIRMEGNPTQTNIKPLPPQQAGGTH
jgi:hypothetical protein